MQQRLPRFNNKRLVVVSLFALSLAPLVAQDVTNYLTPGVARVGSKLACRCGGCKESVGQCPMIRCDSAEPMRRRIFDMQAKGVSDASILQTIVGEQGTAALFGQKPLAWIAWLMPPIVLLLGFAVYSSWVKRNRATAPAKLTSEEQAMLDRFRNQIEREGGDAAGDRV